MKNTAFIMRGLPGSGKSTIARALGFGSLTVICSTDDLRYVGREYVFDPAMSGHWHRVNQEHFQKECELGQCNVICDNTNITLAQMEPYIQIAKENRYEVQVITVGDPTDPTTWPICAARNIHRVPLEAIQRMGETFELERDRRVACLHSAQSWVKEEGEGVSCDDCESMIERSPNGVWYRVPRVDRRVG